MSIVAVTLIMSIAGLFGRSGKYYEFSRPLELSIEEDAEGIWHHRISELGLWACEPTRQASHVSLTQIMDEHYENFALASDDELMESGRQVREHLLTCIAAVR